MRLMRRILHKGVGCIAGPRTIPELTFAPKALYGATTGLVPRYPRDGVQGL